MKNEYFLFFLFIGYLITTLSVLFYSYSVFFAGFHNVDLCHNEIVINKVYGLRIYEIKLDGTKWNLHDCYIDGLNKIMKSFVYLFILPIFLLVSYLILLFVIYTSNKNLVK